MPDTTGFSPQWASPPGSTIAAILRDRQLTVPAFARSLGQTEDAVRDLLSARATIDGPLADKLEAALGATAAFWLRREAQYRQSLQRTSTNVASAEESWLDELPVRDMVRFGWVRKGGSRAGEVRECLEFFGVATLDAWRAQFGEVFRQVAFRASPTFAQRPAAVAAWLRQAELESSQIPCEQWDPVRFRTALAGARALSRKRHPREFLSDLQRLCSDSGVALVIVRAPSGCRASGAARFLGSRKALIVLSFRYLSDDHFWFTFFHEAGHLLLHSQTAVFVDGKGVATGAEEHEANAFASETLIPKTLRKELDALPADKRAIRQFALQVGVSPGIVVGQLQHSGRIPHTHFNQLKARYTWDP